jgi:hypothetical protein
MEQTKRVFPTKHLMWVDKEEFDNFLAAARGVKESFDIQEGIDAWELNLEQANALTKLSECVQAFDPAQPVPVKLPTEPEVEVHADGAVEVSKVVQ